MSGYGGSKAAVNHMVANLAHDFFRTKYESMLWSGCDQTAALESVLTPEIEKVMFGPHAY